MTLTETRPVPAEPVTRERTTRDVLLAAAEIIERDGWSPDGEGTGYCVMQAVWIAEGPSGGGAHRALCIDVRDRLDKTVGVDPRRRAGKPADIFEWNDRTGRTVTEVLAALRAAAETAS